ncbi:ribose-phosphate pyrophosphokinase [Marinobacter sp. C18]|jgi:ribose-phosphate pyrophosphokinase|uniref:ribose-phosphate diphosphokinase n=1 Tax=Marinobacter sp. C18 TaxID=1772288 RepID=UPI000948DA3D|nr:ribose-phosphate diphosphokinase [Marinobacter sp. C18]OLF84294.1 ribose-phosphate pyrophosphokinase [Marinobacter sp. C18]
MGSSNGRVVLFCLESHPLREKLCDQLGLEQGRLEFRRFPDGETYLRVDTPVSGARCIVLADLSNPDARYLAHLFLFETLRELGARSVGLVAPYLCYMRQDRRFRDGEAVTSGVFARSLSRHIDWLITVDPHLHRYHSLGEIYSVPTQVVQGAPALAGWLRGQNDLLLVGPDAESEQWVASIAEASGHPYVIGAKQRLGDRRVEVALPDISRYQGRTAIIIDDVISSGRTVGECVKALRSQGIEAILCAAVHGIFAEASDQYLLGAGLQSLVTTNTIPHSTNGVDISELLAPPIRHFLNQDRSKSR